MKIQKITLTAEDRVQYTQFDAVRPRVEVTAELEEGDDPEMCRQVLQKMVQKDFDEVALGLLMAAYERAEDVQDRTAHGQTMLDAVIRHYREKISQQ